MNLPDDPKGYEEWAEAEAAQAPSIVGAQIRRFFLILVALISVGIATCLVIR